LINYRVAMNLADVTTPASGPAPAASSRARSQRVVVSASIALLLAAGGVTASTYYYDSIPLIENSVTYPVISLAHLPEPVAHAFVAAVDPDFYESGNSLITRRYTILAAGSGDESSLRTRIMANKAEASHSKQEILERYLNRADFGRGATGLAAAAQTYFQKPATQLNVAEAAVLAVQLHPGHPAPKAGWDQILNTMVDRGWLTAADRNTLTFPG
jgi:membrane peptidoglycan carboxypeptidase